MPSKRTDYSEIAAQFGPLLDKKAEIQENGCWIIPSPHLTNNKPVSTFNYKQTTYRLLRLMYTFYKEPVAKNYNVKTNCGTFACFNPDHMYLERMGRTPEELTELRSRRRVEREALKSKETPTVTAPTPTPDPLEALVNKPLPRAHTAELTEDEVAQIKDLLRLARGVKAYLNGHVR